MVDSYRGAGVRVGSGLLAGVVLVLAHLRPWFACGCRCSPLCVDARLGYSPGYPGNPIPRLAAGYQLLASSQKAAPVPAP
jgi:hypothetical protein